MRLRNGILAVLVAAAFPASASAAPDFTSELSADKTTFAWEGEGTGVPVDGGLLEVFLGTESPFWCGAPNHECDFALLDVKHPGDLTVFAEADGAQTQSIPEYGDLTVPDIDLYLYAANDAGEPEGDDLSDADGAGGGSPETFTVKDLPPGKYLAVVSFFLGEGITYKANASLKTAVPPTAAPVIAPAAPEAAAPQSDPAPAPAPQSQPATQSQPAAAAPAPAAKKPKKKVSKRACQKKARKIKNGKKRAAALKKCAKIRN